MKIKTITHLLLILMAINLQAQNLNSIEIGIPDHTIVKIDSKIILDGSLEEAEWAKADLLNQFAQYRPADDIAALGETEIRLLYDDEFLYVSAKCYSKGKDFIVSSLKRDYGFGNSDNISFLFDTFGDKTNCYLFGMNPFGAQREAWISNGGKNRSAFDPSWDNKWYGKVKFTMIIGFVNWRFL